jgi:uncharacterized membrane protein
MESKWRSITKAVSWRVVGTIDTMILSYFFTGRIDVALAIGGTEVITKVVIFYFHERLWSKINWGKNDN